MISKEDLQLNGWNEIKSDRTYKSDDMEVCEFRLIKHSYGSRFEYYLIFCPTEDLICTGQKCKEKNVPINSGVRFKDIDDLNDFLSRSIVFSEPILK